MRRKRLDSHQFAQAIDLGDFDANTTLSLGTGLQVVDRDSLTADFQIAQAASSQPIIERRHRDSQTASGLGGGKQFVGHSDIPQGG